MTLQERIAAFAILGQRIGQIADDEMDVLCRRAQNQNNWFTKTQVVSALQAWQAVLTFDKLSAWLDPYDLQQVSEPKAIGILLAGNIPAVGFHDLMCALLVGHRACIKLSSSDQVLMQWLIDGLLDIDPRFAELVTVEEMLKSKDAYIATGSDNSARYFEYYFGRFPHIIRRNRSSIAVLDGHESHDELVKLGSDIFQYYGLGCRNVSKLFVNNAESIKRLLDSLSEYAYIADNHKYFNNYEYNKSIYLVNREHHLDNGFLLVKESTELVSPISVLFFETYSDPEELQLRLSDLDDKIQCVLSRGANFPGSLAFGEAQCPNLDDYADGIDTVRFLKNLL